MLENFLSKEINSFDELMADLNLTAEAQDNTAQSTEATTTALTKQGEETKKLGQTQQEQAKQVKSILDDLDINKVLEAQVKLDIG